MALQRSLNAHELGIKRMLNNHKLDELLNGERPAKRTYELIPTIPRINKDLELSRPRSPKWMSEETGEAMENQDEFDNAAAGLRQAAGF
jgi:hypothetical protein